VINKGEILSFSGKKSVKFPIRFRIEFRQLKVSQDEGPTSKCAWKFRKYLLEKSDLFTLIGDTTHRVSEKDVYFYRIWAGHIYVHIAIFSSETLENFSAALKEFAANEGTLEFREESIKLIMNQ